MAHQPVTQKSAAEMEEEYRARMDAVVTRTSCICGWSYHGTARDGREAARVHRAEEHPEILVARRRKKANPARFTSRNIHDDERSEIETERIRRAFLLGIDLNE